MRIVAAVFLFAAFVSAQISPGEYRSLNGTNNNLANPNWGAVNTPYARINCPTFWYSDGAATPKYFQPDGRPLPSGRVVSNALFAGQHMTTSRLVSDVHTYYGMVITGDLSNDPLSTDPTDIPNLMPVPTCDPYFDVLCAGAQLLALPRNVKAPGTGTQANPRNSINTDTHWLDLSNVYGSGCDASVTTCPPWRTGVNGKITKVWYTYTAVRYVPKQTQWFMGGDIRINKTPPVSSIIEIYHREHNRLCDVFAAQHPDWSDEKLFQEARKWTIAFHQKISTREYLATLLGEPLPPYAGYNSSANPTIEDVFATNAFRYGHAEMNSFIRRTDAAGNEIAEGDLVLRDNYFQPLTNTFNSVGIEPVLLGLTFSIQGLIGMGWVDDIRNMPFGARYPSAGPTNDLASCNIHRNRDHGIPPYNDLRVLYGLPRLTSWADFSTDNNTQAILASLYTTVDDVDSYVGCWMEQHKPASSVGPLWWNIVREQFLRLRDGDRFWYENPNGQFTADEIATIYNTTLPLLIERNTNITSLSQNIFFVKARQLPDAASGLGVLFTEDSYQGHLDLSPTYRLGWTINDTTNCIDFRIQVYTAGWIGIGFKPDLNTMKNADIVLTRFMPDNNTFDVFDCYALDVGVPKFDTDIGGTDDIKNKKMYMQKGLVILEFSKPFQTADKYDHTLEPGSMKIIFAYNPTELNFVYHGPTRSASYTIDFWTIPGLRTEQKNAKGLIIAIAVLMALLGVACFAALGMVLLNLDNPIIRYATPLFCVVTIVGVLVSLVGLATQLPDPTDRLCMANFWLISAGFVLTFGSVFVKSWRIWRVLAAAKKLERQIISQWVLGGIVGVALLLDLVYMAIWQGVDPLKKTYVTISGSDTQFKYACRANSDGFLIAWIAYHGVVLLVGLFLAFKVKDSFREFNESKGIVTSIYIVSLVVFFCIPLGFGLRGYPNIELVIEAIGILFAYAGALVALFWDKFKVVVLKDQMGEFSFSGRSTGGSGAASMRSQQSSAHQSTNSQG